MSDNNSGGITAIVAIVAIVIIIGIGYFVAQNYTAKDGGSMIKVELPSGENPQ